LIHGLAIDDIAIGPTPAHWRECDEAATFRQDACLVIVASLLGDVFGWTTLQEGRLVQNVLPIKGEEMEQSGHGSTTNLEWHTEDGFHPYRCDYLGFLGMRNVDLVPTTFASVRPVPLAEEVMRTLFEPRFLIRPDNEHLRNAAVAKSSADGAAVKSIGLEPAPVPVLFGDRCRPYLRIDPYFMDARPNDSAAAQALQEIVESLDKALEDLLIGAGDLAFVDNYLAVHGRRPFDARYDGTDRWLKKVTVSRDLRRSRELRAGASSRVLS
jgi:Fe(II)/alpha-ketoglutarate-dependent arginine beta-hydroxylase